MFLRRENIYKRQVVQVRVFRSDLLKHFAVFTTFSFAIFKNYYLKYPIRIKYASDCASFDHKPRFQKVTFKNSYPFKNVQNNLTFVRNFIAVSHDIKFIITLRFVDHLWYD